MSSFKKVDGMIDSLQKQATGLRTLDGSAIEDFLSIAGYEDPAGGGGGGGGDSDFSTAALTIVNDTAVTIHNTWFVPQAFDGEEDDSTSGIFIYAEDGSSPHTVILYKGKAQAYFPSDGYLITTSGDIEDDGDGYYIITGDCTVTVSTIV